MRAVKGRPAEGPSSERRSRRTDCLADALRFQLDACREEEGLEAIVVSDELGFCVAHSGGDGAHAELAAQLPIWAGPAGSADEAGDEESHQSTRRPLVISTFSAAGTTLHACAVGTPSGPGDGGVAVLDRVAAGFTRLLA